VFRCKHLWVTLLKLSADESFRAVRAPKPAAQRRGWVRPIFTVVPSASRLKAIGYSFADQALATGGVFLANVALARVRSKEEYGMFALSYSVYMFLSGLHNAAILEPFTVYGSGRYRERFSDYLRLMARNNLLFGFLLSGTILLMWLVFWRAAPHLASRALLGLGLTVGVLLSGIFLRRAFYVHRQPALAAKSSLAFFLTVALALWLAWKAHLVDGLWVFVILALGWTVAGARYARKLALGKTHAAFSESEPGYWSVHWKYARWVLSTAFVFQLMTQGYYWLVAEFLSVKEVGELRAMFNLVAPMDQIFIALSYLVLPAMAAHYAMKRLDNLLSLWRRYALAILGVTALFALGIRILGQQVMHVLYAGKFDDLGPLLFLLALLPVSTAIGNTMAQALNASERPKLVFYGFLSSGAATFATGIPLVMRFGLRGAVYGMLLSGTTFSVAIGILFAVYAKAQKETEDMRLPTIPAEERQ
jgi:O-antigen/teichoic acid export membrane protein